MMVIIEIGVYLAGAIVEYALRDRWRGRTVFAAVSAMCFSLSMMYVLLFPGARGYWFGLGVAVSYGLTCGLLVTLMLRFARCRHKARAESR